jgi:hypothetical protein
MNFDKSKVYTAVNAEELKVGSKVIVADNLSILKKSVLKDRLPNVIKEIEAEDCEYRFSCDDGYSYAFAYLIEGLNENQLKWTELKLGDVITNGNRVAMVTEIDKECAEELHIYAGHLWFNNIELAKWVKVEK